MKVVRAIVGLLISLLALGLGGIAHPARADTGCPLTAPTDPQPGNLDSITADTITLSWKGNCATTYELHIDDQPPINLTIAEYSFSPPQGIVNWRVIAFDGDGHHAESSTWRFEVAAANWLATPIPISQTDVLYKPPVSVLGSLRDTILVGCATVCMVGVLLLAVSVVLRSRRQRRAKLQLK